MSLKKTSIKYLANVLGVSVATVSKALNGYPDVKRSTRDDFSSKSFELVKSFELADKILSLFFNKDWDISNKTLFFWSVDKVAISLAAIFAFLPMSISI